MSYERDELGPITQLDEMIESTSTTRKYEYDAAGRLERVRDGGDVIVSEYEYDGNGARVRALTASSEVVLGADLGCGATLAEPVDTQDRLCRYGDYDYVYDDNGRLATKTQISTSDETSYTYDGLGRLRRVVLPDATQIDYVHNALGRRIGKVVDGVLEKGWRYGTDSLRPMAQLGSGGVIEQSYVYETRVNVPDYIVLLDGTTLRVITDHLGSVRLVVNIGTGVVVQRVDYDEFGVVLVDTASGFQPFGFAGGLYDPDTQLTRFGARDYDALTGRWTAKDPILFEGGTPNLYEYVKNNPINETDPSGLAGPLAPLAVCLTPAGAPVCAEAAAAAAGAALALYGLTVVCAEKIKDAVEDVADCAEELAHAIAYCTELGDSPDPPPGVWGGSLAACIRGQLSERCGGNPWGNPRPDLPLH